MCGQKPRMKWRAFGRTPQWVRLSDWLASTAAEALAVSWRGHGPIEAANGERCKSGLRVQGALRLLGQQAPAYDLANSAWENPCSHRMNACDTVSSSAEALKGGPAALEPLVPGEMGSDS